MNSEVCISSKSPNRLQNGSRLRLPRSQLLNISPSYKSYLSISSTPLTQNQKYITPGDFPLINTSFKRSFSPELIRSSKNINIVQLLKITDGNIHIPNQEKLELIGKSAGSCKKIQKKYTQDTCPEALPPRQKSVSSLKNNNLKNIQIAKIIPLKLIQSVSHKIIPKRSKSIQKTSNLALNKIIKSEVKNKEEVDKIMHAEPKSISICGWENESIS